MKEKLFSVTKDQFDWQFFRAGGKGGQKQNKTSSACRCIHRESDAIGESREERQQSQNRKIAFLRCVNTKEFNNWIRAKSVKVEKLIDEQMKEKNIKVEFYAPHEF